MKKDKEISVTVTMNVPFSLMSILKNALGHTAHQ